MAASTGPVLLAGALAAANETIFGPAVSGTAVSWAPAFRLVPVTAGLALALAGLEKVAPGFAVGLAWLLVAGVLIFPPGSQPSILTNVNKVLKL